MDKEPKEQIDAFEASQLDLKLFTHIGDVEFHPIYDEVIEADADTFED